MTAPERGLAARTLPLLLLAAALPLSAGRHRHRKVKPAVPAIRLVGGNRYSLAAATAGPDGKKYLSFTLVLTGGGRHDWLTESCNPVMPVVDGKPVPLKQCFTNFYKENVLDNGQGLPQTFLWPLDHPAAPLRAGQTYRLAFALATDCTRSNPSGPGLAALGDCKTTMVIQSPPFTVTE
jgi:hypothetical protein